MFLIFLLINLLCSLTHAGLTNSTSSVFGEYVDALPSAFGDFNSDKLTDLFVIKRHADEGNHSIGVFLANVEKLFSLSNAVYHWFYYLELCQLPFKVHSMTPGDFNGDGAMDLLVTTHHKNGGKFSDVYIFYGDLKNLNCSTESLLTITGQPLVLDYNGDMIPDILADDTKGKRSVWLFFQHQNFTVVENPFTTTINTSIVVPNSNTFIDLNQDMHADIFIHGKDKDGSDVFEYWVSGGQGFDMFKAMKPPPKDNIIIGQSTFNDVNADSHIDHILPVCFTSKCTNSAIFIYTNGKWFDLNINFTDPDKKKWTFPHNNISPAPLYTDVVTARMGDFNFDGFPDMLITLKPEDEDTTQVFLLTNKPCLDKTCNFERTFEVQWKELREFKDSVLGTFYDIYDDGLLDIILVQRVHDENYQIAAVVNSLDYDANFFKILVLTGACYYNCSHGIPYGTNQPGAMVCYNTTDEDGSLRQACIGQLSQNSHFSLQLPYSVFGLGRMPNFVDSLTVGMPYTRPHKNLKKTWKQIIPNSQMLIIPSPLLSPSHWVTKLFITPSHAVLQTGLALTGTCILVTFIIVILHYREKKSDRIEKLQRRFHFDAM